MTKHKDVRDEKAAIRKAKADRDAKLKALGFDPNKPVSELTRDEMIRLMEYLNS